MADSSLPQLKDGEELGQIASAATSPIQLLQTECEAPDLLATSNDILSEQGPAALPALVVSTTSPTSAPPLPDSPILAEIPSIQSCVVKTANSEKASSINESLAVVTPDSQEGTLSKAADLAEPPSHVLDSQRKATGVTEFHLKNPSIAAEALSDLASTGATAPAETSTLNEISVEKHAILVPVSPEKSTVVNTTSNSVSSAVVGVTDKPTVIVTTSSDKSSLIADSCNLTETTAAVSKEMLATVVSSSAENSSNVAAAAEKSCVVTTAAEKSSIVTTAAPDKMLSLMASSSLEKTPAFVTGQLKDSAVVDITSPQMCETLETVQAEEPDQTKPSSHASEGEFPQIDSGRKPASLPVASPDQSALPTALTHSSSSLSSSSSSSLPPVSTISSPVSSVNLVDGLQLPCSASSQDSAVEFGSTVIPAREKGLAQVDSSSSSNQDPHKCLSIGSKSKEHMKDNADGCESDIRTDTTLNVELEREGFSCANSLLDNSSEVENSEQQIQLEGASESWNDVDSSHETAIEALPLIVDTHTISQEDGSEEHSVANRDSEVNNEFMSPSVLSSQISTSNMNTVPLLESEPLQPVTIGSSLQPLEEVQEASMLDDPSFAADLALIDSSADEADSIGGLVINSVIGAADGVVDFHPEEEMETDRELTDISASAPQVVEESCDNVESSDETGPSAKRMRFENGISDVDDRLQGSKKVIIKVLPVKNGHGLWDSHKLQQVLLAKGTILLRLHASTDILEMFEHNKNEKEVDFTGIMAETKDGDHDHILGLASLDPDADVYDPLALSATQSADHTSPPHYSRPYPHSRGRSTALQPAMSRPGFRHLQSPPHPHYYTKHEVFGLPPPLEFEEPQLGTTDWSGKEYYAGLLLQRKASPPSQYPAMPPAPPPPRGRKRGRPPLSSRRGFPPYTPRGSPSKARSQGKHHPEPIKFRPPTPPHHLFLSSLFRLSKSLNFINKNDYKKSVKISGDSSKRDALSPGEGRKGAVSGKHYERALEEDDITVTESQPHFVKHETDEEHSQNNEASLKKCLIKLPCDFCDLVFRKKSSLLAHMKHKHRGMQECPICKEKIKVKNKYGLRFHILKNHKDQPLFHCAKCGESFKLQHHLTNHERLKHEFMDSDDDEEEKRKLAQLEQEKILEKEEEEKREKERMEREKREREEKERKEKEKKEKDKKEKEKKERERREKEKIEKEKEREKIEKEKKEKELKDKERKEKEKKGKEEEAKKKKAEKEKSKGEQKNLGKDDRKQVSEKGTSANGKGKTKTLVSGVSVNKSGSAKSVKNVSHGKIMNVKPPAKAVVAKSTNWPPRPPSRVTRSKPQVQVVESEEETKSESESDEEEEEVDEEEEEEEEDEEEEDNTTSSSESELEEVKNFSCDICDLGFSHLFKLKHHQKEEHSRATRSQAAARAQEGVNEVEEDKDDEEEDEEEEDDEEEELRKEKERKEKERKEKEESLTCRICNKICRSDYQLKLHMPAHTTVRKGQVVKKPTPSKSATDNPEEQTERKSHTLPERTGSETSRVLRSKPVGPAKGINEENPEKSKDQSAKKQDSSKRESSESSTKEKRVSVSKERCEPPPKDKVDKNERPSYLLKVGSLFRCTKCNITFNREKSMTYHMKKIHETLYPFRGCEHCGKIFRSCGPYNRHVLIHRVHHCPEPNCKAKYRKMLRLKQHQKNAHTNKPYRCQKCVSIFAKKAELEKHQEAKHPRIPSEDECSDEEEEEEEEEEEDEERKEDESDDDSRNIRETDSGANSDELNPPLKRKARCLPISYKEPEDEEDVVPLKRSPDKRKYFDKSDSPEKKKAVDKRSIDDSNIVLDAENHEPDKRTRLNNAFERSVVEDIVRKTGKIYEQRSERIMKNKTGDKISQPDVTAAEVSVSPHETPPQNVKQVKKTLNKCTLQANKKNKVNLSWTAALKAQIQAAKSGSKSASKQKKSKNNSVKVRRRPSTGSAGQNSMQGSELTHGHSHLNLPSDSLSYPGYLVGEDSMFSLDDSSQMDIMGDYYGAQYPPSEEISDFVPDDDESGPAKIIDFDSF